MLIKIRALIYRLLGISCPYCNGHGERFVIDSWDCDACDGKGHILENKGM